MLNYLRKIISPDNPLRLLWHKAKALVANLSYGFPGGAMVIIGVTGTNGKTTTAHMIEHILRSSGKRVGMISTSDFSIDGIFTKNKSKKTTMSPFLTQKFLKKCMVKGVEYMVIEASSHALHQHRLWGIPFSISVITNITHEHLDYHRTMEKYADAKKELFRNVSRTCSRHLPAALSVIPHKQAMILNTEDSFFEDFNKVECPTKFTYGFKKGAIKTANLHYSKSSSKFDLHYHGKNIPTILKIPGSFNVENAMAATGAALACQVSLEDISKALASFEAVGGRMETIKSPQGFEVIVDFALTPDSLEKLYKTIRQSATDRVIGIIGSCGDRDKEKRPILGKIVAEYSDITIVTDEEPYTEDPMEIMRAVLEGAKENSQSIGHDLHLIKDRYEAIEFAIMNAEKGDVVVLTGMGNLPSRTLNHGAIKWDEREVVREIIAKIDS